MLDNVSQPVQPSTLAAVFARCRWEQFLRLLPPREFYRDPYNEESTFLHISAREEPPHRVGARAGLLRSCSFR